jgi:hypothetical protein
VRNLLQTCKKLAGSDAAVCSSRQPAYHHICSKHEEQQMRSMQKLAWLCSWIKQHAGLVGCISFEGAYRGWGCTEPGDAYCEAAEQLLALALQEAAAAAAAPPAAALIRTALQLRSCSITCAWSSALLLALPASLTHLDLMHSSGAWRSGVCLDSSSITAAVAQLSHLRSLHLVGEVGNACLAAVGQLAQLTALDISRVAVRAEGADAVRRDLHLLPQKLQSLVLTVSSKGGPARVALGHLTALKKLAVRLPCSAATGSSLPSSLTALTLWLVEEDAAASSAQHLGLTALQQLQHLDARSGLKQPQLLKQLSKLAALTDIVL